MKILCKITLGFDIFMIAFVVCTKIVYYTGRFSPSDALLSIGWSIISILFSAGPAILLTIPTLLVLKKRGKRHTTIIFVSIYVGSLLCNILFEIISIFGGGMCLDYGWVEMAERMLLLHFCSIIPGIMTFILAFEKQNQIQ